MASYEVWFLCKREHASDVQNEVQRVFHTVTRVIDTLNPHDDLERRIETRIDAEQNADDEFEEPITIDGELLQQMIDEVRRNQPGVFSHHVIVH